MTNYEKYKDRIAWLCRLGQTNEIESLNGLPRLAVVNEHPQLCVESNCRECALFGSLSNECFTLFIEWCMQEVTNE